MNVKAEGKASSSGREIFLTQTSIAESSLGRRTAPDERAFSNFLHGHNSREIVLRCDNTYVQGLLGCGRMYPTVQIEYEKSDAHADHQYPHYDGHELSGAS